MPKQDTFTRDIRQRVRQTFGAPVRYGGGVAKLFLASGKDFFSNTMPAPGAMLATNREILDDAIRFLRAPTEVINKQVNRALATDDFKALQKFGKNALEDLKSGKFYDPDRDRTDIGMQMDFDIGDFGGVDMDGFDEGGDWGEVGEESQDIKAQIKIATAQEESASKRTGATINAIGASTEALVDTENANTQLTLRMSMKQHSQQMSAAKNVITAQTAMFELVNRSVTAGMEVAREAHTQVMTELGDIKTLLTDIKTNTTPPEPPTAAKYREQESVFGNNGELDIKKYLKSVVKGADEKFGVSSMMSTMTMGMGLKGLLELVADNPWKLISDMVVSNLVDPKIKKQMERTNRNMESFFPALLQKFADRGKLVEEGKSDRWQDALMGLFGIQSRSKSSIDTKMADPLKQGVITNKFTNTVEEVIPMWLARIDSHISGSPLMVYNHTTGKLEKAVDVVQRTEHSVRDLAGRMGDGASEIFDRAEAYKFRTRTEKRDFENFLYQYLQNMAEEGKFINPYQDAEKFKSNMPIDPGNKRDLYYNLLTGILKTMDEDKLTQLSREMYDARVARDQNTYTVNQDLRDSGLIGAWAGFLDENIVSKLRSETRKKRSGMTSEDIDKVLADERRRLTERSNPGMMNTNSLLNDILGTLRKGIVTYSYSLGALGTGDMPLTETAKDVIKATGDQRSLEAKIRANLNRAEDWRTQSDERDRQEAARIQQNNSRTPSDFIVSDTMTAEDIEDIQKDFIRQHIIDPNNRRAENYRKAFGQQLDAVNGARDRLSQATGAGKMKSLLQAIADKPFQLFDKGMKIMDAFMLKALFGDDAIANINEDEEPDLLKLMTETLNAHMKNAKEQFIDTVADPMKDYLLNSKRGLIPRIGARLEEMFRPVKEKIKDKAAGVVRRIAGEREEVPELDENGNPVIDPATGQPKMKKTWRFKGGRVSGTLNKFTDAGDTVGGSIKNAVSRLLYGDYANSSRKGVGEQTWIAGPDGLVRGAGKQYGGVIGRLRQGFDMVQNIMFGPDSDDPDDTRGTGAYAKRRFKEVTKELNKAMPDMIIGGGAGLLASMFLPGGPVLGTILGSSIGFVRSSEKFKTWLFGDQDEELVYNADGSPKLDKNGRPVYKKTRKGALISKEVYEGISKFAPAVTKGSLIGAVAGGLGLLPFGMGSTAGMVIGAIGGMTGASDQVKKLIFGDGIDPDSGLISKNFKEKLGKNIKRYAPATLAGALGGNVLGGILDAGLGLIPGLSIIPGGPIMTMMGSMVGLANADTINKFFFGDEVEQTVTETDANGNEIKKTKKVRQGGLFGRAYDYTRDHIFAPAARKMDEYGKNIGNWFHDSVITPLSNSMKPLKESMERAGQSVFKAFSDIGNNITTALFRVFNIDIGEGGFKSFIKDRFMPKLKETTDKFFGAIGKVIGNILSAPFKALEYLTAGTVGGKTMDEIREDRNDARRKRQSEKRHQRAEKRAARYMKRAQASKDSMLGRFYRRVHPEWYDENGDYNVGDTGTVGSDVVTAQPGAGNRQPQSGQLLALPPHIEAAEQSSVAEGTNTATAGSPDANIKSMADDVANKRSQVEQASQQGRSTSSGQPQPTGNASNTAGSQVRSEETERVNREKNTKDGKKKRDATSYLKEMARYVRDIKDEIKGQIGGVGWNTAYIKTILETQFGPLSNDQLPEEMEGSTRNIKKRRGFFGKMKDRAFGFLGAVRDRAVDFGQGAIDKALGALDVVAKPFKAVASAANMAGKALGGLAKGAWSLLKDLYGGLKKVGNLILTGLTKTVETAGNLLANAARGIGSAIGSAAAMIAGTARDFVGMMTSTVRAVAETVVSYIPDVAQFMWKGGKTLAKGVARGAIGLGKLGIKGIKGAAGMAKRGVGGALNFIGDHLPGGKRRKEERENRYKNIGTFKIAGGKLDDVTITHVGSVVKPVTFPVVNVVDGTALITGPEAIPVYILGAAREARLHILGGSGNAPAPQVPSASNLPALPGATDAAAKREADKDFKSAYERADRMAEKSSNPADAYDKAVAGAKTAEEMRAIALAQQMNTNNGMLALPSGQEEEKKDNWLMDMLGLGDSGGGGLLNMVKNFFGKGGGGSGFLSGLMARFGATKAGQMLGKAGGVLGNVGSFIGTATKGLGPLALGTLVGQATGTQDRGITNGAKAIGKVVSNLFTDGNVVDAAGNLTKVGWGTKIANFAHNMGTRLLGGADDAIRGLPGATDAAAKTGLLGKLGAKAAEWGGKAFNAGKSFLGNLGSKAGAAVTTAKNSDGLVGKILTKVADLAQSALNNPIVKKIIPSNFLKSGGEIINAFKKKLGTALASVTTEGLEQFAKKLGVVITIVTTAYDIVSGFNEAANILKIDSTNLTTGMRVAAGVAKGLSGLAFGLIPVSWLTETIYKIVADDDADAKLDEAQAQFKNAAAASGMSLSDYNNLQNKTTWQSIKDTASSAKDTVVNGAKAVGNTIANGWNSFTNFITGGSGEGLFGTGTNNSNGSAISPIHALGEGIGTKIMEMMSRVLKGGRKALPTLFSLMGGGIGNAFGALADAATGQKGSLVSTLVSGVTNGVNSAITGTDPNEKPKGIIGKATSIMKGAWDGVRNVFGWGTGGKVTPMSQKNVRYNRSSNNMAKAGCGPTAAAMVASAYGKKLDPKGLSDLSYGMGMRAADGGTNPAFFGQVGDMFGAGPGFGMKQGPTDPNSIQSNLQKGQPVVLMGKGGPFGGNMHYLVADGMGKGGQVNLVDPLTGARKTAPGKSIYGNTSSTIYSYGKGPTVPEDETAATTTENVATPVTGGNPLNKPFKVTSPFGKRNLTGKVEGHKGIDLVPSDGSRQAEVGSRWNGTVTYVTRDISDKHTGLGVSSHTGGNMVFIKTDEGYTAKHMHLKHGSIPDAIQVGAKVRVGQKLGDMGSTGRSTGPHLHYQLEDTNGNPFDPYSSVSGGKTMSEFTNGAVTGTTAAGMAAGVAGLTSGAMDFSSASGSNPLDLLSSVVGQFDTKLDNVLNGLLNGGATSTDGPNSDTTNGTTNISGGSTFNFGASAGSTDPTKNKAQTWRWLRRDFGLTEPGAAGIMGCWQAESSNRPDRLEGDYLKGWKQKYSSVDEVMANNTNLNDYVLNYLFPAYDNTPKLRGKISKSGYRMADGNYYPGLGLAQWTKGRAFNLLQFAKSNGMDWRDLKTQLLFFKHETEQSYPKLKGALNAAKTPEEGARAALDGFEMYSGWSNTDTGRTQLRDRATYAAQIYNTYHGTSTESDEERQAMIEAGKARRSGSSGASGSTSNTGAVDDLLAGSTQSGTTGAGPGLKTFSAWGTGGADTNLNILNEQIETINRKITKVKQDAEEGTTVAKVTNAITDAVKEASGGSSGGASDEVLKLLTTSLGQMIQLLSAIKDNTDKRDAEDARGEYPKHTPVARADEINDTGVGVNDNDIGAKIIDALTYK